MTLDEIAKLEELMAGVTALPMRYDSLERCLYDGRGYLFARIDDRQNAALIVAAVNSLPALLAAVRERDALRVALAKIDAIRNSIIGRQSINWSMHIYPLVAALDEAGSGGEGYDVARPKAEAECARLQKEVDDARAEGQAERDALAARVERLRDRIADIADNLLGLQPVEDSVVLLDSIEQRASEHYVDAAQLREALHRANRWIVSHGDDAIPDHACAACCGTLVVDGFVCALHAARAALAADKEKPDDR